MYIDRAQLQAALKELDKAAKWYDDERWRKRALGKAATVVVKAARARAKGNDSKKEHFYYGNRKGRKRRGRGEAMQTRVNIQPGNLRKSIQYLRKLRKSPNAVIGPLRLDKIEGRPSIGSTVPTSSGYYAQMSQRAYSGAESFRRDIMEPALQQSAGAVVEKINTEIAVQTGQLGRKLSFWQ